MTSRVFRQVTVGGALVAATFATQVAQAQQPAAAPGQQQPGAAGQGAPGAGGQARPGGAGGAGAPGGGAPRPPAPPPTPDGYDGFVSLFDGATLNGWDYDPMFWRVENGVIVAESTPEKVLTDNTFMIWRGGNIKDFEMKVDVRFAAAQGNSGIQVRSHKILEPSRTTGQIRPWGVGGPQVDIVPGTGAGNALIYEEAGRGHLARQGQITRRIAGPDGAATYLLVGTLGPDIGASIKPAGEWNTFHVVGRGNVLSVSVNGRLSAMTIDDDPTRRALEGLLALQMHTGQPFRLEYRNVYLKQIQ